QVASPVLGNLTDAWFTWLENPGVLSPKTRRPYAPGTIARYRDSWARFFAILPRGREATMADLTKGWLLAFRQSRKKGGISGATINRDLVALSAFFTWCQDEQEMAVVRPTITHELGRASCRERVLMTWYG